MRNPFRRQKPEPSPAAVARRVESERATLVSREQQSLARQQALAFAQTIGTVSEPMTPRAEIAAQVAADRARRKTLHARRAKR